ncbi:MAG: NUDIX hydrolase [Polymorphobacter sp.]
MSAAAGTGAIDTAGGSGDNERAVADERDGGDTAHLRRGQKMPPKDAATLLIIRRDAAAPRVLMGRRHRGNAFMPDKWVFPGGRIDAGDYRVAAARELDDAVAAALARTAAPRRAAILPRALALAAIRETFEETGLLLAQPANVAAGRGGWRDFRALGWLPDLAPLQFVARAITPPGRTRRFDARFFVADAAALVSLDPGTGSGELDELAWFDWDAALALDLPSITRAILHEVALREADPDRPIPFHSFTRRGHVLGAV